MGQQITEECTPLSYSIRGQCPPDSGEDDVVFDDSEEWTEEDWLEYFADDYPEYPTDNSLPSRLLSC